MKAVIFKMKSVLIGIFLVIGCSSRSDTPQSFEYGFNFNPTREKLGLPIIEKGWIEHNNNDSIFHWTNVSGKVENKKPHHVYKNTKLKETKIFLEKDSFHYWIEEDSIWSYRLNIFSFFNPEIKIDSQKFELVVYFNEGYPPTRSLYYSKVEADSVLKAWELDFRLLEK